MSTMQEAELFGGGPKDHERMWFSEPPPVIEVPPVGFYTLVEETPLLRYRWYGYPHGDVLMRLNRVIAHLVEHPETSDEEVVRLLLPYTGPERRRDDA